MRDSFPGAGKERFAGTLTARRNASEDEPFRNLYFTGWERLTYVHVGTSEESRGRHRADQKKEREREQCPSVH